MKTFGLMVVVLVALVGCGPKDSKTEVSPEEAARRAGLRREQFSGQAKGEQKIQSDNGTMTELLKVDDLGQYGLKLYPGATAKEGEAFRRTDERSITVSYSLITSDPAKNVTKFYEMELSAEAARSDSVGTLVSGALKDGKSAVVTILDEGAEGTKMEIQILEGKTK